MGSLGPEVTPVGDQEYPHDPVLRIPERKPKRQELSEPG